MGIMGRKFLRGLWHSAFSVFLFLTSGIAHADEPKSTPLYLSYEKRLILTYLLAGSGESEQKQLEIAQRLQKTIKAYAVSPAQEATFSNFEQFLKIYQGPWPNSYSIESDLQLIEKGALRGLVRYRAVDANGNDNPVLQKQIENFMIQQNQILMERSLSPKIPMAELSTLTNLLLSDMKSLGSIDRKNLILLGFRKTTSLLNRQLSAIEQAGERITQTDHLKNLEPGMRLFLETVFKEYFARLSLSSKKFLISKFLGTNLSSGPLEKFELMIMGSGPQFQKLLQIMADDDSISPELGEMFEKLQSKVLPIPPPIVKEIFESERNRYHWVSYELEPLGTGTMAQTHKAQIRNMKGNVITVVARFLKPEIAKRVKEDAQILSEIAVVLDNNPHSAEVGFPKLSPHVENINRGVTDELLIPETIARQIEGKKVYDRVVLMKTYNYKNDLRINVPWAFQNGSDSQFMIQELAQGTSLDKQMALYANVIPDLGRGITEELVKMWVENAIFTTGFFHADLHKGNYIIDVKDYEITLYPFDFGMGGKVPKKVQKDLVETALGIELKRADLITNALWKMSLLDKNEISKSALQKLVQEKLKLKDPKDEELGEWLKWSMKEGLQFPYELVNLRRGFEALTKSLQKVGSPYSISDLAMKLAPKYGREMAVEFYRTGIIKNSDILKLGWQFLTNSSGATEVVPQLQLNLNPAARKGNSVRCEKIYGAGA